MFRGIKGGITRERIQAALKVAALDCGSDSFTPCGNAATKESHTCPFKSEIYDSKESCHCCADCSQQCADDI